MQKDQQTDVSTEDTPRLPKKAVVTSDLNFINPEPRDADQPSRSKDSSDDKEKDDKTKNPAAADDDDSSKDSDTATDTENKPRRSRQAERRIKRLSQKVGDAERRAQDLETQLHNAKQKIASLEESKPKPEEPKRDDFKSDREFARAYIDWEDDTAAPSAPKKPTPSTPPAQDDSPAPDDKEVKKFTALGQEKLGDEFLEALGDRELIVSQPMGEYILDTDFGPDIYVHLSNNHEEALRIAGLPTHKQVKEMAKLEVMAEKGELDAGEDGDNIEFTVETESDKEKVKPKQRHTPPSDVRERGESSARTNPEKESMDDYIRRRRKENSTR